MKILRSEFIATVVSLFLLFAMAFSLVALPTATAADTRKSYPYIGATPNPIGVGQEVLIHTGITHQLASTLYGWEGLTVTVTKPDDTTETLGPFRTDPTGGTGTVYVPTMAGNYTLQTHFPEQVLTAAAAGTPAGTLFPASDSEILTLVVTEEQREYWPAIPQPTEYWTRPIDPQFREWAPIAGHWLTNPRNDYAPGNDDAPETAHVLWTKPHTTGGLVGGDLGDPYLDPLGDHGFEEGDAYEGKWSNRFIIAGKLYYNKYSNRDQYREIVCVDLHTGEELWSRSLDDDTIDRGQLMYWDTYDYHGVYDYLWTSRGSTWQAWDPFTGDWVYTMEGVPSGTTVYSPKGEILRYNINLNREYMYLWNSSNIPELFGSRSYGSPVWGAWRPNGKTVNASGPNGVTKEGTPYTPPEMPLGLNGYQWNVSIPDLPGSVIGVFPLDKVVGSTVQSAVFGTNVIYEEITNWGISLKPGQEGQLLFKHTWQTPTEWRTGNLTLVRGPISSEDGIFTIGAKELRQHYGFSTDTGEYLWVTEPTHYLNIYNFGIYNRIAYGKFITVGTSGIVKAFDVKTGETAWTYDVRDRYTEILWSDNWPVRVLFMADGKVYLGHEEHSPVDPKPRGAPFVALDVETGEEVFRVDGLLRQTFWGGRAIIGDSIIASQDTYDQRVYALGKGPSATTVTAPDIGVQLGKSVLVQGTVTDISPGTEEYGLRARFPDGVPAVSDADMSEWMLYVYKQFPRPADATGVEVAVSVIDPNNNVYEVGTAISDANGFFSAAFTPEVAGKYTVFASFEGSGAYYGSFAEAVINVEEAPAATPPPTPEPAPMTDTYVIGFGSALIVVVAIGFAILILRKR